MSRQVIINIIRFIILVFIQIAILNNIRLNGYVNPYLYVIFILALPFKTPGWLLLILGFLMGITIDLFSNTLGFHTAACTMMAYFRPYVLQLLKSQDDYPGESEPSAETLGFAWFLKYSFILVAIHHIILFFVEMYRFTDLLQTLVRIVVSIIFTLALVLLTEYLFPRK